MKHTLIVFTVALLATACEAKKEESPTRDAFERLQQEYEELVADRGGDPVKWAAEDIENLGDWEYRVETIPFENNEAFATALNALGNDRWEVIWMEPSPEGFLVILKKPSVSLLSKIPLSQLGRLLMEGGEQ